MLHEEDNMVGIVLLVDDGTSAHASVHLTERKALASLRANYADGEEVDDSDLIEYVQRQGCIVYLKEVDLQVHAR